MKETAPGATTPSTRKEHRRPRCLLSGVDLSWKEQIILTQKMSLEEKERTLPSLLCETGIRSVLRSESHA